VRAPVRVVALCLLVACAPAPKREVAAPYELGATEYSLPKDQPGHKSTRDLVQIADGLKEVQQRLMLTDAAERDATYQKWSGLLLDARALDQSAYTEEQRVVVLAVLGELYREGSAFGVHGAAELADQTLSECLRKSPGSVPCNMSLVELDLTSKLSEDRVARIQRSLAALRQELGPEPSEFVEAELVHLRMLQRDGPRTQSAIDAYLEDFPHGQFAEQFRRARTKLDEGGTTPPEPEP
jgi:hypothetical protein